MLGDRELMLDPDRIIEMLRLEPQPIEGGWFVETYRSAERWTAETGVRVGAQAPRGERSLATAIYYLLRPGHVSAMHRLAADEIYHFYLGDPVEMLFLEKDKKGRLLTLGNDLAAGDRPQIVVPRGTWQGARLIEGGRVALMGTTVARGFDAGDFELGDIRELAKEYPDFADAIRARAPRR